jgi:transcriptional regulator with XRE-family HTH domain
LKLGSLWVAVRPLFEGLYVNGNALAERLAQLQLRLRWDVVNQAKTHSAIGISVATLRNWEQDRRQPEGPALALLRIAARHPRIIRENASHAA